MSLLTVFVLGVAVLAGCAPARAASPSVDGGVVPRVSELVKGLFDPDGPKVDADAVRAARDRARGDERVLFERLLVLLDKVKAAPDHPERFFADLVALNAGFGRLDPNDFALQRRVVGQALAFPALAESFHLDRTPYADSALMEARRLVERFPREPGAHGILAAALQQHSDDLGALRELKACVDLDARQASCRAQHERLAQAYIAPRCKTDQVRKSLALYPAYEQRAPGRRRMKSPQGTVFLARSPALTAVDIQEVRNRPEGTVVARLTPPGTKRFEEITGQLAKEQGQVAVLLDDRVVMSAKVYAAIPGGTFTVSGGDTPKDLLTRMCEALDSPRLPKELELRDGTSRL